MELHQLRYFVATAETRSASRAAERCGVAQPSLSQQLRKLEDSLGTRLFDRIDRGMHLTDAGAALLPRALAILQGVDEAQTHLLSGRAGNATLAVGAIPTMAPYLIPPALRRLRDERPDCRVTVREELTDNLLAALGRNEIDVAILSNHAPDDLIESSTIGREELLVIRRASGKPDDASISLADLRGQPVVTLQDIHCLGQQIDAFCSTRRISPDVVCRTTQLQTVFELVAMGLGVSLVPQMAANIDRTRDLARLHIKSGRPTRDIVLAYRRGRTRPAAAELFAGYVKDIVDKLPERSRPSPA